MMIKKRFGIFFLLLSLFFLAPINLNTPSVSGAPSNQWYFTASETVECVAISADGNYIVAGTDNGYIYLFEKSSNSFLWSFQAGNTITSVAISNDGSYIIVGCLNNYVYFFNNSADVSKTPMWIYSSSSYSIREVAITSNGDLAVAANSYQDFYVFDTINVSNPLYRNLQVLSTTIGSVDISSDGSYIVIGTTDGILRLYDTSNFFPPSAWIYDLSMGSALSVLDVQISREKDYILACSGNGVFLVNKTSKSEIWNNYTGNIVQSVDISLDGSYCVSGNAQGNFSFFNTLVSVPTWSHSVCDEIYSVAISADGNYAVYGGNLSDDGIVYIFNKDNPIPLFSQEVDQYLNSMVSVAISANGRYVVVGTSGNLCRVYLFEVYSVPGGIDWLLVGGVVLIIGGTAGGLAGVRRRIKKKRKRKKKYKLMSGSGIPLTPIEILKEVGNKEALLMKFQEAKTIQSISPIKDVILTPVSAGFVEKAGKLGLEPLELKEFLEEMLALTPIERNEIIDRMLLVSGGAS